ncbi:MAG: hypothetical protein WA071_01715 [Undibacterium umbellatum]|uniref:hypothetical protein n=1 Tax=Undibacterium umbellatum TaxID=2762300 RepID=UPI003BB68005
MAAPLLVSPDSKQEQCQFNFPRGQCTLFLSTCTNLTKHKYGFRYKKLTILQVATRPMPLLEASPQNPHYRHTKSSHSGALRH